MTTSPVTAALAVVELARQGRFTEIQEQFAQQLRPMVPAGSSHASRTGSPRRGRSQQRGQYSPQIRDPMTDL